MWARQLSRLSPSSSSMVMINCQRYCSTYVVSASLVKELREKSGAPMMECKKALASSNVNGSIDKAIDWLRAKGIAKATSNSDRIAAEGLIVLHHDSIDNTATLVEVNSETDFVARNKEFQQFAAIVASTAHVNIKTCDAKCIKDVDILDLLTKKPHDGAGSQSKKIHSTLQDALGDIISTIREKITIGRIMKIKAQANGVLAGYVHGRVGMDILPSHMQMGKSVSLVSLGLSQATDQTQLIQDMGRKLAMHVIAANPQFVNIRDIPEDIVSKEKAIFYEQTVAAMTGKPVEIIEKVVAGKVNKRLSELALLSQPHMAEEGSPVIKKFLDDFSVKVGAGSISVLTFSRWGVGSK